MYSTVLAVPSPTTTRAPQRRFHTLPLSALGFPPARRVRASPFTRRLAVTLGRIAFVSYGPAVHLRLLSTPPHGDAVTFSYRPESACLERTCTSLIKYTFRRTSAAAATPLWISRRRSRPAPPRSIVPLRFGCTCVPPTTPFSHPPPRESLPARATPSGLLAHRRATHFGSATTVTIRPSRTTRCSPIWNA